MRESTNQKYNEVGTIKTIIGTIAIVMFESGARKVLLTLKKQREEYQAHELMMMSQYSHPRNKT